jgi:hypothetical protein
MGDLFLLLTPSSSEPAAAAAAAAAATGAGSDWPCHGERMTKNAPCGRITAEEVDRNVSDWHPPLPWQYFS